MSARELPIDVNIRVKITREGELRPVTAEITQISEVTGEAAKKQYEFEEAGLAGSRSLRRMALDIRLFTSGLRQLDTLIGGVIPGFHEMTQVVTGVGSGFQVAAMGMNLLSSFVGENAKGVENLRKGYSVLKDFLIGWGVAAKFTAISVGVLAGAMAGTFIGERISGISRMKEEMKELEKAIRDVNFEMTLLKDQTLDLNVEAAALNMVITSLEHQIEMTGDPTGELADKLKVAESNASSLGVVKSRLTFQEAQFARSVGQSVNEMTRLELGIQKIKERARGVLFPRAAFRGAAAGYQEQRPGAAGGMGGGVNVGGVTFTGNIYGINDLEAAARNAGRTIGDEVSRSLEYDRYGIRSRP